MAGGPSKINPPNGHPSNPIHKAAAKSQQAQPQPTLQKTEPETPQHEVNKTAVIIGVVGFSVLVLMAWR